MSIAGFFKALLPFSWSTAVTDVDAELKKIASKAEADVANIRAAAAKAQAAVTTNASVQAIKNKLAADVASLQSAIAALTAQAAKDIAAVTPPTPPANPVPAPAPAPVPIEVTGTSP